MSRIIKFRAWDTVGKYFKPLEDDGDYYFRDDGDGLVLFNKWGWVKDIVLLQFTGLLDKNGKEIYEGDILELIDEDGLTVRVNCQWGVHRRVMQSGTAVDIPGFSFIRDTFHSFPIVNNYLNKHDLDIIEIIGNIYETPSLIKPK